MRLMGEGGSYFQIGHQAQKVEACDLLILTKHDQEIAASFYSKDRALYLFRSVVQK
ncbi:hypothetical protein PS898_05279 [Pseudomonas fluorescens]|nr:hypothetical protein PS898_05279 [Pseudomonas fluorescens]